MTWTDQRGVWTYPSEPQNSSDYQWRWKPLGHRVLLQWYDDTIFEWVDEGVYKNEDDIKERIK